jgi:hypothetical protein
MVKQLSSTFSMEKSNAVIPWQSAQPTVIPKELAQPAVIVDEYAVTLRPADKRAIVNALENQDYGMAAGHLWRRSISKLRVRLAAMGMRFLGEMLNREDITEHSLPEAVLTDHDTIVLAETLGFVDATGAMRLRQGFELVSHFESDKASDEMSLVEASSVVRACVQYVFGAEVSTTAISFSHFRDRLSSEAISSDDVTVDVLVDSPLFFLRTTLRVLLAAAKHEEGARLEHSLANLNTLLPGMWPKLADDDRWAVGTTFAELSNVGTRPQATSGVRKALLKVKGFDFVPENLRSNSFKRVAHAVLSAHNSFGNYAAEPEPTKQLAALGTSIPVPALAECLRAYFCVYLGNSYGHSWEAAQVAEPELKRVSKDRWERYFSRVFQGEHDILFKLTESKPVGRWIHLFGALKFSDIDMPAGLVGKLIGASVKKAPSEVTQHAKALLSQYRGAPTTG